MRLARAGKAGETRNCGHAHDRRFLWLAHNANCRRANDYEHYRPRHSHQAAPGRQRKRGHIMSRRPAKYTQADIARVIRAYRNEGVTVRTRLLPDGTTDFEPIEQRIAIAPADQDTEIAL